MLKSIQQLSQIYPNAFKDFATVLKISTNTLCNMSNTAILTPIIAYLFHKDIEIFRQNNYTIILLNNTESTLESSLKYFVSVPISGEIVKLNILGILIREQNKFSDYFGVLEYVFNLIETPIIINPIKIEIEANTTNIDDLPF